MAYNSQEWFDLMVEKPLEAWKTYSAEETIEDIETLIMQSGESHLPYCFRNLLQIQNNNPKPCHSRQMVVDGYWETDCGKILVLVYREETPKDHGYNFCPFCGAPLVQVPYNPQEGTK